MESSKYFSEEIETTSDEVFVDDVCDLLDANEEPKEEKAEREKGKEKDWKSPRKNKRNHRSVIDSLGSSGESIIRASSSSTTVFGSSNAESPDQGYSSRPESLDKTTKMWRSKAPRGEATDARVQNLPSNDLSSDDDGAGEDGRLVDRVARMPCLMDDDCYNMKHKHRGKCVVFNQETFDIGFDKREGSSADAQRIFRTFGNLGFTVIVHDDLPHTDVIRTIGKLSREDHTDNDCICVFVLTHGLNNDMICARDVAYKSDSIWKPFTADKCKTLAGKPKLFFFQACRGEGLDGGVTLMARHAARKSSETDAPIASYKIPTHSDFLIAHSSVQGFYSWRNPEEGTWYVQCLCDVLDENADKMDLAKMLTITARKVATERASIHDHPSKHDQKQVPSTVSMLIRDLYFYPK